MELILVRHGLPVRQEVTEGTADPHLDDEGWAQARAVSAWLARERNPQAVYASTMNRATQTAEPYAAHCALEIRGDDGIVEYDVDQQSYIPMEELKREDPEAWRAMATGGFSETMDLHQFHARVVNSLEHIISSHRGERVVVFCHGGVINIWTAHVLGLTPKLFFQPKYTSIHRYLCASSGERNIESLNEAAHLADVPQYA